MFCVPDSEGDAQTLPVCSRGATRLGEVISADVLNPSAVTVGGGKYLLVLIDQFTSFLVVYVQKILHPSIGIESIPLFVHICANAFNVNIGNLRADLGP